MNKQLNKNLFFTIGACDKNGVRLASKVTLKGRSYFRKLISEKFCPTHAEFIIKLKYLVENGFVIVENPEDAEYVQKSFNWFMNYQKILK